MPGLVTAGTEGAVEGGGHTAPVDRIGLRPEFSEIGDGIAEERDANFREAARPGGPAMSDRMGYRKHR